jgi:hypothetical protein
VFPDINFLPSDRNPGGDYQIAQVNDKLALGFDVTAATKPDSKDLTSMSMQADRDEDFNTRLASYRGWQQALQKVKPIPRDTAQLSLTTMVKQSGARTTAEAVDYLVARFISVPIDAQTKAGIADFLTKELGTADLAGADTFAEEPLRLTLHLILSLPEYQLG